MWEETYDDLLRRVASEIRADMGHDVPGMEGTLESLATSYAKAALNAMNIFRDSEHRKVLLVRVREAVIDGMQESGATDWGGPVPQPSPLRVTHKVMSAIATHVPEGQTEKTATLSARLRQRARVRQMTSKPVVRAVRAPMDSPHLADLMIEAADRIDELERKL